MVVVVDDAVVDVVVVFVAEVPARHATSMANTETIKARRTRYSARMRRMVRAAPRTCTPLAVPTERPVSSATRRRR